MINYNYSYNWKSENIINMLQKTFLRALGVFETGPPMEQFHAFW